jgi:hypothetical protein
MSSSDGCAYADGTVTWNLGTLAAGGTRTVTVTLNYCVIPAGSDIISTAATAWQHPGGTMHGPVFDTTKTHINEVPPSPPPPPPPPPTPAPTTIQTPVNLQPESHSSTMATRPWEPATVQLPNITVQSATLSASKVIPGTPVTVTAVVANRGTVNGSTDHTLCQWTEEEAYGIQ